MNQLINKQYQSSGNSQNLPWICLDLTCQTRWNFDVSSKEEHKNHIEYCIDVKKTIEKIKYDEEKLKSVIDQAKKNYDKIDEIKKQIKTDIEELAKQRETLEVLIQDLKAIKIENLRQKKHSDYLRKIQLKQQIYHVPVSKDLQYSEHKYANYQCSSYKLKLLEFTSEIVLCQKHKKQIECLELGEAHEDIWGLCPNDQRSKAVSLSECRKLLQQYQSQELLFSSTIQLCQLVKKFKENIDLTIENLIQQLESQILKNLPIFLTSKQYIENIIQNGKFDQKEYYNIVLLLQKNGQFIDNNFSLINKFRSEINEENIHESLLFFKSFNSQYEHLMQNHQFSGLLFEQVYSDKIVLKVELQRGTQCQGYQVNMDKRKTIQEIIAWIKSKENVSPQTLVRVKINEQLLTAYFDYSIEDLKIKSGSTINIYLIN